VAFIETCGKFNRIAYPGANCVWPCCGQAAAGTLSLRVRQLDVKCETKTKDNVFVNITINVQYQVEKERMWDAFYRLSDNQQQISSYVFDVVRSTVPRLNLDETFLEKDQIGCSVKEQLSTQMQEFGFYIIHSLVNDVEPAHKVKSAMNEINAARRQRVAALEKAEAEKVAIVKAAEAEAEAKFLQGQGIARQRAAVVAGLRESCAEFTNQSDIQSKDVLELMLVTQYFDMLKDVGTSNRASTIFLPHSPAGMTDAAGQIRDAFLQGSMGTKQISGA